MTEIDKPVSHFVLSRTHHAADGGLLVSLGALLLRLRRLAVLARLVCSAVRA